MVNSVSISIYPETKFAKSVVYIIKPTNSSAVDSTPDPHMAPFSGWAAKAVMGDGVPVLQLNVEGLMRSKRDVVWKLAQEHHAAIILLQEKHHTPPAGLKIPQYQLAAHTASHKYGIATFIRHDTPWVVSNMCLS